MDDTGDSDTRDQPGEGNSGSDFLSRWSRRKQVVGKGDARPATMPAAGAADRQSRETAAEIEAEPRQELTDADMPPLDSLDSDSDFSLFMSPGVSEQLRAQALRKLFHLPAFNVTDGLNDYDEDYTQFAGLGNVVTQEMKRMLKRELEAEVAPEAEPVVRTAAPTESADAGLPEDPDEEGDDEPLLPPGL